MIWYSLPPATPRPREEGQWEGLGASAQGVSHPEKAQERRDSRSDMLEAGREGLPEALGLRLHMVGFEEGLV